MNKESFIPQPELCAACPDRSSASKFIMKLTGNGCYEAPQCVSNGGPETITTRIAVTNESYTRVKCALPFDVREAYADGRR